MTDQYKASPEKERLYHLLWNRVGVRTAHILHQSIRCSNVAMTHGNVFHVWDETNQYWINATAGWTTQNGVLTHGVLISQSEKIEVPTSFYGNLNRATRRLNRMSILLLQIANDLSVDLPDYAK